MPRPTKLSESAIAEYLGSVPAWTLVPPSAERPSAIHREFTAANFASAIGLLNAIGVCAEVADHHPDLLLHGWNKLRVTLSTHDQGGLTELDFTLAKTIDALKF
jgi:4a-hydroxytetrahydrobiopterin dehydratase